MADRVEFPMRVAVHPPAAVIDDDLDLRVSQDCHHRWIFGDKTQIARIDFDNRQSLDLGVVDKDLSPCARPQADQEDFARARVVERERKWTDQ